MSARREFVVIELQMVGSPEYGYGDAFSCDMHRHATRRLAIRHGWRKHGHDDWLIGVLRGNVLERLAWMDKDRDDQDELADAAEQLCLDVPADVAP